MEEIKNDLQEKILEQIKNNKLVSGFMEKYNIPEISIGEYVNSIVSSIFGGR